MDNLTISIVFPTRNAEWCLPYVLEALKKQTKQPEEILFCIGKSEDKTEEIVLNFQKNSAIPVRVFYDKEGIGTGYAMNILLSNATSDVILWATSDVIEPINWVEIIHKYYMDNPDLVYLTSKEPEIDSKYISEYSSLREENYIYNITNNKKQFSISNISGLSSFKRKNALAVGNFDPFFVRGQDLDMAIRLVLSGAIGGDETPIGLHFGVYGSKNIFKAFKHGTYFKFIYKYGLKHIFMIPHHTIGVLIKSIFLFSFISTIISSIISYQYIMYISIYTLIASLFSILAGLYYTHRKISLNMLLLQILGSFGEYYQLCLLIINKNKLPMGYGRCYEKSSL